MKVAIIVFSPSGHTLKVAKIMEKSMTNKDMQVQLLDITRNEKIFRENKMEQYLKEKIEPHDLICVGGPVYAGHFEGNAKNIIKTLPYPDKRWGKLAIPFVTYGGLHSIIALKEAGNLFHKSKRMNILGIKIAAFHTLTKTLAFKINENEPGKEALHIIEELVERIIEVTNNDFSEIKDIQKSFDYTPFTSEKFGCRLLGQRVFRKIVFPKGVEIDYDKCNGCGLCAEICPVNLYEMTDGKPQKTNPYFECICCAECYHNCPVGAISFDLTRPERHHLSPKSKHHKMESPQSAVYPLQDADLSNDEILEID